MTTAGARTRRITTETSSSLINASISSMAARGTTETSSLVRQVPATSKSLTTLARTSNKRGEEQRTREKAAHGRSPSNNSNSSRAPSTKALLATKVVTTRCPRTSSSSLSSLLVSSSNLLTAAVKLEACPRTHTCPTSTSAIPSSNSSSSEVVRTKTHNGSQIISGARVAVAEATHREEAGVRTTREAVVGAAVEAPLIASMECSRTSVATTELCLAWLGGS
mmetsp:Transcript_40169/g.52641  ORF Transcript_40169/g.52641 Transcript_40169/m.52641 type:complete len:222 (+) Transcript_40169:194-859(+)